MPYRFLQSLFTFVLYLINIVFRDMKVHYPNLEDGHVKMTDWYCDEIRLTHTLSLYKKQSAFSASNATDVVRMHFGLKGNYKFSYQQMNKSFDLIGGHHNIMYSNGFDITVENKTSEIETFGIQFPRQSFVQFTQNADDRLKRFSDSVLNGKSALLSDKWGTINTSIADVIGQILHCHYSNSESYSFFQKVLNCWYLQQYHMIMQTVKKRTSLKLKRIRKR